MDICTRFKCENHPPGQVNVKKPVYTYKAKLKEKRLHVRMFWVYRGSRYHPSIQNGFVHLQIAMCYVPDKNVCQPMAVDFVEIYTLFFTVRMCSLRPGRGHKANVSCPVNILKSSHAISMVYL